MLLEVVHQTNMYSKLYNKKTKKLNGGDSWKNLELDEFKCFLDICLLMGLKKLPNIRKYWASSSDFFHCTVISSLMTRHRFESILSCLHLVDNDHVEAARGSDGFDPLIKSRWLLEKMTSNFQ